MTKVTFQKNIRRS